ncbi:MAG: putative holin [Shewanella sp.]
MPEPISSSSATGTVLGLALMSLIPGMDAASVLGAFAGALVFVVSAEEVGGFRKALLFVASFIGGLLLAAPVGGLLTTLTPASVDVSQGVGALVAAAMAVRLLQAALRDSAGGLLSMLTKRGKP